MTRGTSHLDAALVRRREAYCFSSATASKKGRHPPKDEAGPRMAAVRRARRPSLAKAYRCNSAPSVTNARAPPRRLTSSAPLPNETKAVRQLLRHLVQAEGYKQEGIFRVCGDFAKIVKAGMALTAESAPTLLHRKQIYEDLGIYGCADLVKQLIRDRADPLVSEDCFQALLLAPQLVLSDDLEHSPSKVKSIYMSSVLAMCPSQEAKLIRDLLDFLHLTIHHEAESKMGQRNVCALFATLFFGSPLVGDYKLYLQENANRTDMLEFLLSSSRFHPEVFKRRAHAPETRFATKNINTESSVLIRGEPLMIFHRRAGCYVYAMAGERVFRLKLADFQSSTSSSSPDVPAEVPVRTRANRPAAPTVKRCSRSLENITGRPDGTAEHTLQIPVSHSKKNSSTRRRSFLAINAAIRLLRSPK